MTSRSQPLVKTRSSLLQRYSSMELTSPSDQSAKLPMKKPTTPPTLEYPSSPQNVYGEQILHWCHPRHPLTQLSLPELFTCAACKEYGAGKRFACSLCNFQLHEFCALAPPALRSHPFHFQHSLAFQFRPAKGGIMQSKCDACWKPVKGCAFRCGACSFQMHPCCAMLPLELNLSIHPHTLRLLPAASSTGGDRIFECGECKRRRSGRVYHCTVCDFHLHTVCAKDFINGLRDNGIKGPEKPSVLGKAARLASQVVVEFIGGLVEGIGEGVGEVLVQNMTRGRGHLGQR